eukprot:scaffold7995_cov75-Phaeocystis_antarctica.AAC.2
MKERKHISPILSLSDIATLSATVEPDAKTAKTRPRLCTTMPWNCTKLPTVTGKAPPECTLEAD